MAIFTLIRLSWLCKAQFVASVPDEEGCAAAGPAEPGLPLPPHLPPSNQCGLERQGTPRLNWQKLCLQQAYFFDRSLLMCSSD